MRGAPWRESTRMPVVCAGVGERLVQGFCYSSVIVRQKRKGKVPVDHGVISSLVIETVAEYTDAVAAQLSKMEGVEVHGIDGYKIVITIEAETVDESHDIANSIVPITGVIGVNLIYLNFEDDKTIFPNGV